MSTTSKCKMCYRQREAPFFVSRKTYDVGETCMSCRCKSSTERDMKAHNDGRTLQIRTQEYFDGFCTDAARVYAATPEYADVVRALNESKLEVMLYLATRDTLIGSSRALAVTDGTARSVKRDLRSKESGAKEEKQGHGESSMPFSKKESKTAATGRHAYASRISPSAFPSEFVESYTAIKLPEDPEEESTAFDVASTLRLKRKSPYSTSSETTGSAKSERTEKNLKSKKRKLDGVIQQTDEHYISPGNPVEAGPLLAKRTRTPTAKLDQQIDEQNMSPSRIDEAGPLLTKRTKTPTAKMDQQIDEQDMSPGRIDEAESLLATRTRTPTAKLSDSLNDRPAMKEPLVLSIRPRGQEPVALDDSEPRQLRSSNMPPRSEKPQPSEIVKTRAPSETPKGCQLLKRRPKKTSALANVARVEDTDGGEALARQQFLGAVAAQERYDADAMQKRFDTAFTLVDFSKEWVEHGRAVGASAGGGEGDLIPRGWRRVE